MSIRGAKVVQNDTSKKVFQSLNSSWTLRTVNCAMFSVAQVRQAVLVKSAKVQSSTNESLLFLLKLETVHPMWSPLWKIGESSVST